MKCPHCDHELAPDEVRSLWGQLTNSLRKSRGAGPGRPKKLRRCDGCGQWLGAAERRRHECPGKTS